MTAWTPGPAACDRPDVDRLAVTGQACSDIAQVVVAARAYTTVPTAAANAALGELGRPDRVTVAALAVALDQCGLRLVLGVEPR